MIRRVLPGDFASIRNREKPGKARVENVGANETKPWFSYTVFNINTGYSLWYKLIQFAVQLIMLSF